VRPARSAHAFALQLLRADLRRTLRDPVAVTLAILPLAVTLAWWRAAPAVAERMDAPAAAVLDSVAVVVLVLLTPLMFGFVGGLMLLDERDDGVLTAIRMTTAGAAGVMAVRIAAPAAWSLLVSLGILALLGPVPWRIAAAAAVLAALQAPLLLLFLAAFAANKLQGMALAKAANVAVALGALAVLLPPPWQWLAAPSPHFWLTRLLVQPPGSAWGLLLFTGAALAVHAGVLYVLALRAR
jgi:fluoroquinolone transport system permease protein